MVGVLGSFCYFFNLGFGVSKRVHWAARMGDGNIYGYITTWYSFNVEKQVPIAQRSGMGTVPRKYSGGFFFMAHRRCCTSITDGWGWGTPPTLNDAEKKMKRKNPPKLYVPTRHSRSRSYPP